MDRMLGVYIHIPFCASKCSYCDFYSLPNQEELMDKYQQALLRHIRESAPQMKPYYVDTIYFGGGTPSYYGAKRLCEIFDTLKDCARVLKSAEVTVTVVTRQVRSGRSSVSRRRSSSSEADSPTLAAWNQTSRPGGRGSPAMPRRSSIRSGCSLPSACRRRSRLSASGARRRDRKR